MTTSNLYRKFKIGKLHNIHLIATIICVGSDDMQCMVNWRSYEAICKRECMDTYQNAGKCLINRGSNRRGIMDNKGRHIKREHNSICFVLVDSGFGVQYYPPMMLWMWNVITDISIATWIQG
eukprot:359461_1